MTIYFQIVIPRLKVTRHIYKYLFHYSIKFYYKNKVQFYF